MTALTDSTFWDAYWDSIHLPATVDQTIQWHYALTEALRRLLPNGSGKTLFEVGCAPGRWLVWFQQALGFSVAGCDISEHGLRLTHKNLELNRIQGELFKLDLLQDQLPPVQYDVVISLGVVEHFSEPDPIIAQHIALLKPGGWLVLEVPNFAGSLNYHLAQWCGAQDLINVHNLSVMHPTFFKNLPQRHAVRLAHLSYLGGFDPGLIVFNSSPQPNTPSSARAAHLILRGVNKISSRFPKIMSRWNSRHFSHMLLGLFQKL